MPNLLPGFKPRKTLAPEPVPVDPKSLPATAQVAPLKALIPQSFLPGIEARVAAASLASCSARASKWPRLMEAPMVVATAVVATAATHPSNNSSTINSNKAIPDKVPRWATAASLSMANLNTASTANRNTVNLNMANSSMAATVNSNMAGHRSRVAVEWAWPEVPPSVWVPVSSVVS